MTEADEGANTAGLNASSPEEISALHRHLMLSFLEPMVEHYHALAKITQNSVYPWLALQAQGLIYETKISTGQTDARLEIPAWCVEYFLGLADHIPALAHGEDIRLGYPEMGEPALPQITPNTAMELVPLALALRRRGYNAFQQFRNDGKLADEYRAFLGLREEGKKYAEALAALSKNVGALEDSVRRRRLARGRSLATAGRYKVLGTEKTGKT